MQRITGYLRVPWAPSQDAEPETTDVSSLVVSAREQGIRCNRVQLLPGWEHSAVLPMLVFEALTGRPIAVLPHGPNRWVRYEGARLVPVDAQFAASVAAEAISFTVPLPAMSELRASLGLVARAARIPLIGVVLAGLAATATALAIPFATKILYGDVFPSGDERLLLAIAALVTGAGLAQIVLGWTKSMASLQVAAIAQAITVPAIWDRLLRLPVSFFGQHSAGEIQNRIGGATAVRATIEASMGIAIEALFALTVLVVLIAYDPVLALVAAIGFAVFLAALAVLVTMRAHRTADVLAARARANATGLQIIGSMRAVRAAGVEQSAATTWARSVGDAWLAEWRVMWIVIWEGAVAAGIGSATALTIYWVAGTQNITQLSVGTFMGFSAALGLFAASCAHMYRHLATLTRARVLWRRLAPILQAEPEDHEALQACPAVTGAITVRQLAFHYPGSANTLLDGLSCSINAGEFVVITGDTGSGKSTLLKLMLGLESPSRGCVEVDGHDLAQLLKGTYRRQVGAALDMGESESGKLHKIIAGPTGANLAEVWRVAECAGIAEQIRRLPLRMNTIISSACPALSDSELRRLALARALVGNPSIILLDEPTSLLDQAAEALFVAHLRGLPATKVIVSRRPHLIDQADRVLMLRDHQLEELPSPRVSGAVQQVVGGHQ